MKESHKEFLILFVSVIIGLLASKISQDFLISLVICVVVVVTVDAVLTLAVRKLTA